MPFQGSASEAKPKSGAKDKDKQQTTIDKTLLALVFQRLGKQTLVPKSYQDKTKSV